MSSAASLVLLAVSSAGCPAGDTNTSTTNVALSSETGDASTTDTAGSGTSMGGIMTTTEDPESSTSPTTPPDTTDDSDPSIDTEGGCGDGLLQAGEECDNGPANGDDAACTQNCREARCGDGLVWLGEEACDDGVNDGAYNGCQADCAAFGPFCGDAEVEPGKEECDSADAHAGCIQQSCKVAKSCLELKDAYGSEAMDGIYAIRPDNMAFDVYCEMDADDGGYTFLKMSTEDDPLEAGAGKAEAHCAGYGMTLLVPRTAAHLQAAIDVAYNGDVAPVGGGGAPVQAFSYLRIFGIYPKVPGTTCVGAAFNSDDCPEWGPDGGRFWISGDPDPGGEPSTSNCAGCSMLYLWTPFNGKAMLTAYEAQKNGGLGVTSTHFLCEVGDKNAGRN